MQLRLPNLEQTLGDLEGEYRKHFLIKDLTQWTVIGALVQIAVVAFAHSDYLLFGLSRTFYLLILVRGAFLVYCIGISLFLWKRKNWVLFDWLGFSVSVFLVMAMLYVDSTRPVTYTGHLVPDVTVVLVLYMLWATKVLFRALPAVALSIGSIVLLVYGKTLPTPLTLYAAVVSFAIANAIGLVVSIRINNYRRGQFKAEKQYFETNQRLRALMDALPVGVSISDDISCQRITGNRCLFAQFETTAENNISASAPYDTAAGRSVHYYRNGKEIRDTELPLQRAVAEKRVILPIELEVHLPSGRRWFADVSGAPIRDDQGNVVGGVSVTVDITGRKNAEEELRKARDELEFRVHERTAELAQEIEERKQTERALRESQGRYKALYEGSADGIFLLDDSGAILDANGACLEMFGYSLDEIRGTRLVDLIDPEDLRATPFKLHEMLDGGTLRIERRMRKKDGTYLSVEVIAKRVGENLIQALYRDITERKSAEEIRRKALEQAEILEKIFSTTHFCVVFLDRELNFVRVNQSYADTCGYPPELFPGKSHFDLYPHKENESIFRAVVETREPFTVYAKPFEFPDDPDRGVTYWDWSLHPVKDAQGQVEGLIFVLVEVTERKRAEQELIRSNELLRKEIVDRVKAEKDRDRLFNLSIDMLCVAGFDGFFKQTNPAFTKTLGWSQEELSSKPWIEFVHPDDREQTDSAREQLVDGTIVYSFENRYRCKDGSYRWLLWSSFPLVDENLIFAVARDITERKRVEEDLIRSNEDLQQFAYVASHDLQEPLRNVTSCLEILEKKHRDRLDANADQYIRFAVEGAVRMKALIKDLLAYSRIATRGKPPEPSDCEQILDRTVKSLRAAIVETGAVISHDPLPSIYGDDTQLLQVFQNLVGNAIKFRGTQRPKVHVAATKEKSANKCCNLTSRFV